jgi:hypothetical protein
VTPPRLRLGGTALTAVQERQRPRGRLVGQGRLGRRGGLVEEDALSSHRRAVALAHAWKDLVAFARGGHPDVGGRGNADRSRPSPVARRRPDVGRWLDSHWVALEPPAERHELRERLALVAAEELARLRQLGPVDGPGEPPSQVVRLGQGRQAAPQPVELGRRERSAEPGRVGTRGRIERRPAAAEVEGQSEQVERVRALGLGPLARVVERLGEPGPTRDQDVDSVRRPLEPRDGP